MILVTIIPAYNEEETISNVIQGIPRDIADIVEVVVINDGSTDNTAEAAKKAGADKVVLFKRHMGLSAAFRKGLETALDMGADIIVTMDADGQYRGEEIERLIQPIIDERADIVLGSRFRGQIEDMPLQKRIGNIIATRITRFLCGYPLSDAQTGFRAFSRDATLHLNVLSGYTYVHETIIQAANKRLTVVEVPCRFMKRKGKSRLISNIFSYAKRAGSTIIRTYLHYKPLKVFLYTGGILLLSGLLFSIMDLIWYLRTRSLSPYYPLTRMSSVLIVIGFQVVMLGLLADIIAANRRIQEEVLYRLRKSENDALRQKQKLKLLKALQ